MPAKRKSEPGTAAVPAKAVERYRAAKAAIKQWEDVAAKARAEIEKALGENETGTVRGVPVVSWKHVKSTRLDQGLLKKLHPEVHAECMVVSESRRFVPIDPEETDDE